MWCWLGCVLVLAFHPCGAAGGFVAGVARSIWGAGGGQEGCEPRVTGWWLGVRGSVNNGWHANLRGWCLNSMSKSKMTATP